MKLPLVSIIVPIYDVDLTAFELCINSILMQDYKNLEIILVDDGSNNMTVQYLDNIVLMDRRIRIYHKKHEGVSAARNWGVRESLGEYITFVDSDDTISLDMISVSVSYAIENEADIVLWQHAKIIGNADRQLKSHQKSVKCVIFRGKQIVDLQKNIWLDKKDKESTLLKSLPLSVCKLYRSQLVKQNKLYFNCSVNIGEDTLFALEALEHTEILAAIDKTMYFHRIHEGSLSHGYSQNALVNWSHNRKAFFNYLQEGRLSEELWIMYDLQVIYAVKTLLINTFAHPQCDLKRTDLKRTLNADEFSSSLGRIKWKDIKNDAGAIVILLLYKLHLYSSMIITSKMRRKQLEKMNGGIL